jgi:hypothetical protein
MFVRIRIRSTVAADEAADEGQQNCSQPYDYGGDYAWNELPLTGVHVQMVVVVVVVVALWISWSTGTVVSRWERWTGR